jgi:hypothetical protein
MTSITKPILLAVIGILAVVLFLQTSNLITGMVAGNETASANITSSFGLTNTAPTTYNLTCTWTTTPIACGNDTASQKCTMNFHDNDGWINVTRAGGTMQGWLKSGSAGSCATQDQYSCRINASCLNISVINVTDAIMECDFGKMTFFADNGTWSATMNVSDGITSAQTSNTTTRGDLDAIDVQSATINWGSLQTGSKNQTTDTVVNCGNIEQDVNVTGTDMGCSVAGTVGVGNITTGITGTASNALQSVTPYRLETDTSVATSFATNSSKTTYWNITVPYGVSGACTGTIYFIAIKNQTTT